jgi:quercetin dioxygenase-like cupin family protein
MTTVFRSAAIAAATMLIPVAAPAQPAGEPALAIRAGDPALRWGPCPPIFAGKCPIAVLHGDAAKPNADIFLRVAGGSVLPPHSHTSAERMVLVAGKLHVEYQGTKPVTLSAGDYAYGPAGRPHRASCLGTSPCTLFIAFEGPVDAKPFAGALNAPGSTATPSRPN